MSNEYKKSSNIIKFISVLFIVFGVFLATQSVNGATVCDTIDFGITDPQGTSPNYIINGDYVENDVVMYDYFAYYYEASTSLYYFSASTTQTWTVDNSYTSIDLAISIPTGADGVIVYRTLNGLALYDAYQFTTSGTYNDDNSTGFGDFIWNASLGWAELQPSGYVPYDYNCVTTPDLVCASSSPCYMIVQSASGTPVYTQDSGNISFALAIIIVLLFTMLAGFMFNNISKR